MSKLTAPLFGARASGSLGKTLTFAQVPQGPIAKKIPTHPDPETPLQLAHRDLYQDAVAYWNALHEHEKEFYNYLGNQLGITGYNYCIGSYLEGSIP